MAKQTKQSTLVPTWLRAIHLPEHIIETFETAGIVNPSDLAELQVCHYPALGITEPSDRKKLFYLVQRVKMAFQEEEEQAAAAEGAGRPASDERSVASSNNKRAGPVTAAAAAAALETDSSSSDGDVPLPPPALPEPIIAVPTYKTRQLHISTDFQELVSAATSKDGNKTPAALRPNGENTMTSTAAAPRPPSNNPTVAVLNRGPIKPGAAANENLSFGQRTLIASKATVLHNSNQQNLASKISPNTTANKPATRSSISPSSSTLGPSNHNNNNNNYNNNNNNNNNASTVHGGALRNNAPAFKTRVVVSPPKMRPAESNQLKKGPTSAVTRTKSSPTKLVRHPSHLSESNDHTDNFNSIPLSKKFSSFPSASLASASAEPIANTITGISNGPIFIHGLPEDTSFSTQIANLRETNQLAYEQTIINLDHSLQDVVAADEMRIRVAVRKRPMIPRKENATNNNNHFSIKGEEVDVIHPMQYLDYGKILVYQPKTRVDLTREVETISFAFDNVYDETSTNTQIYNETIRSLIPGLFEGRWASVFAYGQTGSGKTFTMMGSNMTGMKAGINKNIIHAEENMGLYFLAARDLFSMLSQNQHNNLSVGVSLFEIYGGKLFDLLNDRAPVKCLEDHKGRVCFPGLSEHPVAQADQLMRIIEDGNYRRSTGSTSANADSSRSHAVLQLCLRKQIDKKSNIEHGRLTFIDLAGSERGADTNKASKTTRLEGAEINTSLLALKEVIRALAMDGNMNHIPFRGSKLTQVLKESFVGKNSRTVMIACVAPNLLNCEHTLNTLRYTDRVKERNSETGNVTVIVTGAPPASRVQKKQAPSAYMEDRPSTAPAFGSSNIPRLTEKHTSIEDIGKSDLDHEDIEVILEDENDYHGEGASHAGSIDLDDVLGTPQFNPGGFNHEAFTRSTHFTSTTELDEILQSPRHKGGQVISSASNDSVVDLLDDDASPHDKRNENSASKDGRSSLISTHRAVMSQMLSMVKQEMLLVNCADTDRELVDEYVIEIERMHDKQLSMIADLREALVDYQSKRPSTATRTNHPIERQMV